MDPAFLDKLDVNYESEMADDEEIEIPIFTGTNLSQWMAQIEMVMKIYEIPDIQWVNFSSIYVDGIAQDWVTVHFEQVCRWSWDEFTSALHLQFGSSQRTQGKFVTTLSLSEEIKPKEDTAAQNSIMESLLVVTKFEDSQNVSVVLEEYPVEEMPQLHSKSETGKALALVELLEDGDETIEESSPSGLISTELLNAISFQSSLDMRMISRDHQIFDRMPERISNLFVSTLKQSVDYPWVLLLYEKLNTSDDCNGGGWLEKSVFKMKQFCPSVDCNSSKDFIIFKHVKWKGVIKMSNLGVQINNSPDTNSVLKGSYILHLQHCIPRDRATARITSVLSSLCGVDSFVLWSVISAPRIDVLTQGAVIVQCCQLILCKIILQVLKEGKRKSIGGSSIVWFLLGSYSTYGIECIRVQATSFKLHILNRLCVGLDYNQAIVSGESCMVNVADALWIQRNQLVKFAKEPATFSYIFSSYLREPHCMQVCTEDSAAGVVPIMLVFNFKNGERDNGLDVGLQVGFTRLAFTVEDIIRIVVEGLISISLPWFHASGARSIESIELKKDMPSAQVLFTGISVEIADAWLQNERVQKYFCCMISPTITIYKVANVCKSALLVVPQCRFILVAGPSGSPDWCCSCVNIMEGLPDIDVLANVSPLLEQYQLLSRSGFLCATSSIGLCSFATTGTFFVKENARKQHLEIKPITQCPTWYFLDKIEVFSSAQQVGLNFPSASAIFCSQAYVFAIQVGVVVRVSDNYFVLSCFDPGITSSHVHSMLLLIDGRFGHVGALCVFASLQEQCSSWQKGPCGDTALLLGSSATLGALYSATLWRCNLSRSQLSGELQYSLEYVHSSAGDNIHVFNQVQRLALLYQATRCSASGEIVVNHIQSLGDVLTQKKSTDRAILVQWMRNEVTYSFIEVTWTWGSLKVCVLVAEFSLGTDERITQCRPSYTWTPQKFIAYVLLKAVLYMILVLEQTVFFPRLPWSKAQHAVVSVMPECISLQSVLIDMSPDKYYRNNVLCIHSKPIKVRGRVQGTRFCGFAIALVSQFVSGSNIHGLGYCYTSLHSHHAQSSCWSTRCNYGKRQQWELQGFCGRVWWKSLSCNTQLASSVVVKLGSILTNLLAAAVTFIGCLVFSEGSSNYRHTCLVLYGVCSNEF